MAKKVTVDFIFAKKTCGKKRTPYNAPPLTETTATTTPMTSRNREPSVKQDIKKFNNKTLTLSGKRVIYAALPSEKLHRHAL